QEDLEELKFARLQVDNFTAAGNFATNEVYVKVSELKGDFLLRTGWRPARKCGDARQQFAQCEGLHEIVVSAALQSLYAIFNAAYRGQEDYAGAHVGFFQASN